VSLRIRDNFQIFERLIKKNYVNISFDKPFVGFWETLLQMFHDNGAYPMQSGNKRGLLQPLKKKARKRTHRKRFAVT
jgi:hypothetical protein